MSTFVPASAAAGRESETTVGSRGRDGSGRRLVAHRRGIGRGGRFARGTTEGPVDGTAGAVRGGSSAGAATARDAGGTSSPVAANVPAASHAMIPLPPNGL